MLKKYIFIDLSVTKCLKGAIQDTIELQEPYLDFTYSGYSLT